jgi:Zn-dependent protease with chaperone function
MMLTRCLTGLLVVTLLALSGASVRAAAADEQEIRLGQSYAKELESKYKVISDPAVADRVARIGNTIAQVSDRATLPYSYKVIKLDIANALSLPGGFIYITTGMLSFVRSDHELAAVLAHETVHAAHGHQMEVIRRSNQALFWTVLLAALTRDAGVLQGANIVSGAALSGFSRELERDADLTGISYLVKTEYTPVAMLTVMERLWREVQYSAQPDPGAYRDHPVASERVAYILSDLLKRQIPINRRLAANYLHVSTRPFPGKGQPAAELLVNDTPIVRLPDASRIETVAARLDVSFDSDPPPFEVNSRETEGGWGVYVGTTLLLVLTSADATFLGFSTPAAAATEITAKLRWVIDQDQRMRRFKG